VIARLGLRLALAGGREAVLRLVFTAIGVWVGLTLLLLALAGVAATNERAERSAWLDAGPPTRSWPAPRAQSADGALFLAVTDYHDGTRMTRAYVAALGVDPPVPPGLDRLPGPGEVAVSPAMKRLLDATPDDQLDERFPGTVTMTIGPAGLAHENQLVALIGRTPDQLAGVRSVREIRGFEVGGPPGMASFVALPLLFGLVPLLAIVVLVIFMVTRIAWARREQRLAAIRLAGASRLQIAAIAAVDTGLAAAAGTAMAWATYEVVRRIVAAKLVFQGGHFWPADVGLAPSALVLVLAGTPALVMLVPVASLYWARAGSRAGLRQGRRAASPVVTTWMTIPVLAAVAATRFAEPLHDVLGSDLSLMLTAYTVVAYLVGFVLIGPWLCRAAGVGIARLSRRAPGLIAARRIAADPYAAFRAVSIVVLALSALTYLGSVEGQLDPPDDAAVVRPKPGVVVIYTGSAPESRVAPLLSPDAVAVRVRTGPGDGVSFPASCAQLSRVRYLSCPHADGSNLAEARPSDAGLPVSEVYIPTDGTLAAEGRIRNQVASLVPNAIVNSDRDPVDYGLETAFVDFGRLITIAALFVLLLAAVGITAGMIGGLLERRRQFALLRAAGVRLGELRQAVLLETAATMVLTSVAGVGLGMLLAFTATRQAGLTWTWPDPEVYAYAGGGVLVALILSALVLPLVGAATRYDAIRYE
jgi:hypothetical protein